MLSTNFYKRINYLLKKDTKTKVILTFILDRIKHPFLSIKKKKLKKMHQKYLNKKKISVDYFSIYTYYWQNILNKYFDQLSYLEIGSWEGNSALYILKNFKTKKVVCVDIWKDKDHSDIQERNFRNFKSNMKIFKKRFQMHKGTSDSFFKKNKDTFDVIYIDGSHEADQVYRDLRNSWNSLNLDGIIICDDYFYGGFIKDLKNLPIDAINKFIAKNSDAEIICVNNAQIFLKKTIR